MVRGFTNIFRREFAPVNLDRLAGLPSGSEVTPDTMVELGLLKNLKKPVKVLGRGELEVPLTVEAHRFSGSARTKIEAAGGTVREIG
jgi:large subunit ribosomal protein L15